MKGYESAAIRLLLRTIAEFSYFKKRIGIQRDKVKSSHKVECDRLDDEVWGEEYKIAVANLKGRHIPYVMEDSKKVKIVKALFPKAPRLEWAVREVEVRIEPFSEEEVAKV